MKQKLIKNISYWTKVSIIGIILGISLQFVRAWTEPTVAPPGGNLGAPLNTSVNGQAKAGGLILNTGGAANGLIVQNGNVGIGTASPAEKLSIVDGVANLNIGTDASGDYGFFANAGGTTGIGLWSQGDTNVLASGSGKPLSIVTNYPNYDQNVLINARNVGIGTATPAYKLDVSGDVNGTRLCIAGSCKSSWPSGGSGSGTVTSVATGTGLTGGPITSTGTLAVNTATIQARVTGSCPVGQAIRAIDANGGVTCQASPGTCYWAGRAYTQGAECYGAYAGSSCNISCTAGGWTGCLGGTASPC